MLVRCERCRAVYQLAVVPAAHAPAVQCVRCQHLFEARAPFSLGTVGTLGGAAAQAVAAAPQLRVLKPPRNWTGIVAAVLGLALVSVCAAGVSLFRAHVRRSVAESPPELANTRAEAGEVLLWRDDVTSLEGAVTAFSEAQSLEPENAGYAAQRALATLLLGLSLRAENEDLTAELKSLEGALSGDEVSDGVEASADRVRVEDLHQQLPGVASRAESFLQEGLALLTRARLLRNAASSPEFERAELLADALLGRRAVTWAAFENWQSNAADAPSVEAWRAYTAGIARTTHHPTSMDWEAAKVEFDLAARLSPHFTQAKWQLARACLSAAPPDHSRAKAALEAILQLNPHHEGAARVLRLLAGPTDIP